ncbi:MAG: R3H domain-containing nucleic acid-binding protein [Candidatus Levybacteria bacterium]|nr:R3H domain-containing nucleic acid-binding protein [Candidatus Levybacteria bacterium]
MSKKTLEPKTTDKSAEGKIIKKITEKLLKNLEVEGTFDFSLSKEGEEEEIEIVLDTNDSGIVIGYHGEVLEALQLILSLIISKKVGRFIRVSLDVGDYKKNRSEFLKTLALQTKEKVLQENKEFSLPSLKSWERRIVHMLLQDDDQVKTESIGEGKERTLVIKPRN